MIRTKEIPGGVNVQIAFNEPLEIFEELPHVIASVRENLREYYPDELVDLLIETAGKLAYAESKAEQAKIYTELIRKIEGAVDEMERSVG